MTRLCCSIQLVLKAYSVAALRHSLRTMRHTILRKRMAANDPASQVEIVPHELARFESCMQHSLTLTLL